MDTFHLILYISNVCRSPAVSKHQSYMYFFLHFNIRLQSAFSFELFNSTSFPTKSFIFYLDFNRLLFDCWKPSVWLKLYSYPLTAASRYFIYSYFSLVGFYFESLSFVINTSHPLFFTLVNTAKLKQTVLVREQRGLDYPVIYIILCKWIYRFIGTFQIAGLYIFDDFHFSLIVFGVLWG